MPDLAQLLTEAVGLLPPDLRDRVVVFGTAPMVLAGIKPEAADLDLFVDDATFEALIEAGFTADEVMPGVPRILLADEVEVYRTWLGVTFDEVFAASIPREEARGLRVASLDHVLAYKVVMNRPKDASDIDVLRRAIG